MNGAFSSDVDETALQQIVVHFLQESELRMVFARRPFRLAFAKYIPRCPPPSCEARSCWFGSGSCASDGQAYCRWEAVDHWPPHQLHLHRLLSAALWLLLLGRLQLRLGRVCIDCVQPCLGGYWKALSVEFLSTRCHLPYISFIEVPWRQIS